jgi:fructose-1,6-bisphosphatase/inositol monophosphatase family enzyme
VGWWKEWMSGWWIVDGVDGGYNFVEVIKGEVW